MKNDIIIYEDKDGKIELKADVQKDTIWATQEQIAQIFQVSSQNITTHYKNIFKSGELNAASVCKESLHTGKDGKRYLTKFYNLDAIIAVGYRVNSKKATQFRIWATGILHRYLVEGYTLNKPRLEKFPEKLVGLYKAISFLESNNGRLRGKITLKLTEDLVSSERGE